jgi:WD40 repeat protein
VVGVLFHPTAENILASASFDLSVRVWDIQRAEYRQTLLGHTDAVVDQSWSYNGALLATTSRDKSLRIFDVRAGEQPVQEIWAHEGVKGVRLTWLGHSDRIVTTGFSRVSDRQCAVWDQRSLVEPIKMENLDVASGIIIPHYDNDTKVLYLSGKVRRLHLVVLSSPNAGRRQHPLLRARRRRAHLPLPRRVQVGRASARRRVPPEASGQRLRERDCPGVQGSYKLG